MNAQQPPDPQAWLMDSGVKSASFKNKPVGYEVKGKVVREPETQQQRDFEDQNKLLWWDDEQTRPKWMLQVVVQTDMREDEDDDGLRAHYLSGRKKQAVVDAIKAAGAKGLDVGGDLSIVFTGEDLSAPVKKGFNPPKTYKSTYVPPAPAYMNDAPSGWGATTAPAGPAKPDGMPQAMWDQMNPEMRAQMAAQFSQQQQHTEPPF